MKLLTTLAVSTNYTHEINLYNKNNEWMNNNSNNKTVTTDFNKIKYVCMQCMNVRMCASSTYACTKKKIHVKSIICDS